MKDKKKFHDYDGFVEKFKPKKTTDDCYTPKEVYDVILDWCIDTYDLEDGDTIVRPFYPGGDYENYDYPDGCYVIDNPPFSCLSKIITYYLERDINFFLFAPALSFLATAKSADACYLCNHVCIGVAIVYENGAKVPTSFVTNMRRKDGSDASRICETAPELYSAIEEAQKSNKKQNKYAYPYEVLSASMMNQLSKYGVVFSVDADDACFIYGLDAQKPMKKQIYGHGYLLSQHAAAQHAAAQHAAAQHAGAIEWTLSDRERDIIAQLSKGETPWLTKMKDRKK